MSESREKKATLSARMGGLRRLSCLIGLLQVATPGIGIAQAEDAGFADAPGGYGLVQAGLLGLDLDGLNSRLVSAGLPPLEGTAPAWGGAGYGIVGRFHIGGMGHGGLDPHATNGAARVALKGGYGLARVKYRALSRAGLTVFPALGLGWSTLRLTVTDFEASSLGSGALPRTFEEVLADPGRSATLSTHWTTLMNAGLALDYRVALRQSGDGSAGGIVVGVESGYLFTPGAAAWTLDDLDLAGGPDLGVDGFYFWLSIGWWGRGADDGTTRGNGA